MQAFGTEITEKDGQLNRQRLGDIIFKDAQKRQLLNSITHPAIQKQMYWLILKAFLTGSMDMTVIDYSISTTFAYCNLKIKMH